MIRFETSLGNFDIELFPNEAPISAANFEQYAADGHFDSTIFHRVIPGFVIQGGGYTEDMRQKTTRKPIKNEADNGLKNLRGTLSMARTSEVNSATSQFFVNLVDNAFLDHGTLLSDPATDTLPSGWQATDAGTTYRLRRSRTAQENA
jgi:peptidyl-prolyl cis-trans isomerase A (cyclophilin A)